MAFGDLRLGEIRIEVLRYLGKVLYLQSLEDIKKVKSFKIYLHRLLLKSGILVEEDLKRIDLDALSESMNGSEMLIKASYTDQKGVVRRGVYRVSLEVQGNIISFGRKKFQQNLNYTYLNSPDSQLMREWDNQETGADYPEGEGSGSPASFWDYPKDEYMYNDWSGSRGYLVDYDFDHYDDHLWED
jgi:hypothetical protein